ncbi:unnamed protein product [Ceratitis capitata]|uniref:(Mediterranean fruit fly) hypothetical protein n=1 Tax=Ceratitis capitata TaxID=7213 RepID=A0A811UIQ4_CERCA|nr:unnamed protein product [Ceratitis capitata]
MFVNGVVNAFAANHFKMCNATICHLPFSVPSIWRHQLREHNHGSESHDNAFGGNGKYAQRSTRDGYVDSLRILTP